MACSPCEKSQRDVTSEIVLSPAEAGSGYRGTPGFPRLKPWATVLTAASPPVNWQPPRAIAETTRAKRAVRYDPPAHAVHGQHRRSHFEPGSPRTRRARVPRGHAARTGVAHRRRRPPLL